METPIVPIPIVNSPVRTGAVPAADIDFGIVVKTASTKWNSNPWLTLLWTTAAEFAAKSTTYQNTLDARLLLGSTRPQITKALKVQDDKVDYGLAYVKGYITEKYGKEIAVSYYAAFGIQYKYGAYIIPKDQNARSASLTLMVDAIAAHGFELKEYGTAYWTAIKTAYNNLLEDAISTDGDVSSDVGNKNILKKDLKKGLNAIIHSIKSNYPDNYKQELRSWGFQKEKY